MYLLELLNYFAGLRGLRLWHRDGAGLRELQAVGRRARDVPAGGDGGHVPRARLPFRGEYARLGARVFEMSEDVPPAADGCGAKDGLAPGEDGLAPGEA